MSDKSEFVQKMWWWTIVPAALAFGVALIAVIVGFSRHLLGDKQALSDDSFKFSLIVIAFCIPFYVTARLIRKFLLTHISKSAEER